MPDRGQSHGAPGIAGLPSATEADEAVREARRMFQRTLAAWACDLLALRRAGLERPAWVDEPPDRHWSRAA